jgi:hypothetical protein
VDVGGLVLPHQSQEFVKFSHISLGGLLLLDHADD